jgi:hypothetical protein
MAGRDDSINKLISVFSQPVQNSLTDQSVFAAQPPEIKVPLKPHQLTMIQAMGERENKCIDGFTIDGEIHHSQFAVLGDKVGSGKTLMMLGHISKMKAAPPENVFRRVHPNSRVAFWSERPVCDQECSGNTLIIVPHTLFHQWKHAIQTQTNLSFLEVRTTKVIERADFLTLIKQRDITLMSNTTIRNLMADPLRAALQWKRIVFDEVDSVHFTSTTDMPRANFYWLITATWGNFLFHGLYVYLTDSYLNTHAAEFHPDLLSILQQEQLTNSANYYARYDVKSHAFFEKFLGRHPNRGHLVLRNSDGFMADSWRAPTVNEERIICESPMVQRVLANFVTAEVQELLHAGDTQGAFERLGVSNTTKSSLIEAVCESREKELDRLQKTLAYKETIGYATPAAKEQALQSLRGKIQSLQTQITELNTRITNFKHEMCAICFEEPTLPTFVMCCNRVYCGKCLMEWLQRAGSCALCRQAVDSKMLRQLKEGEESPKGHGHPKDTVIIPKKPKKREALLNIITGAKDGRFLVFNRYDNPFVELEEQLKELGHRVATVRGNKDHISKVLKQFEKGEIQILLMNSTQAGAGMDLKSATHIILMHAMKKEEEKQIVGRAMRLGRTEPLRLVRLLHENEQILA